MKKAVLGMILLLVVSAFAGCKQEKSRESNVGQKINVTSNSDSVQTTQAEKLVEKTEESAASSANNLWNSNKAAKLLNFMNN